MTSHAETKPGQSIANRPVDLLGVGDQFTAVGCDRQPAADGLDDPLRGIPLQTRAVWVDATSRDQGTPTLGIGAQFGGAVVGARRASTSSCVPRGPSLTGQ